MGSQHGRGYPEDCVEKGKRDASLELAACAAVGRDVTPVEYVAAVVADKLNNRKISIKTLDKGQKKERNLGTSE